MKWKFVVFCIIICNIYLVKAQDSQAYARKVVERLSSAEAAGRGYTYNGLQFAENEILSQFSKIGLKKFNNSYLQTLSYPINIIDSCFLSLNGIPKEFGKDYIVSGFSKTGEDSVSPVVFNTSVYDSLFRYQDFTDYKNEIDALNGKAIVFPTVDFPPNYVLDSNTADDLYRETKMAYIYQQIGNDNKVFLEVVPQKLTMSLANEPRNTYLFSVLEDSMPEKISTLEYKVKSHFEPQFQTSNIIGYIEGIDPSKKILITCHYDHLGQINDAVFSGANDNASGVAMMLAMAKYYALNKPKYTMVFIAFTGEEAGLQGSKYFVKHPPFNLKDIALVCNFDIVGTGDEGIQIVNSAKYFALFNELLSINEKHQLLKQIKKRGDACNSDHCPFDEIGIPSIFTYTLGGYPYYHDIYDTADNLSLVKFNEVMYLFTELFNRYKF